MDERSPGTTAAAVVVLLLGLGCGGEGPAPEPTPAPPPGAAVEAPEPAAAAESAVPEPAQALAALPESAWEEGCSCTWSFAGDREGVALSGSVEGSPLRLSLGATVLELRSEAVARETGGVSRYHAEGSPYTLTMTRTKRVDCSPGDLDCEGTTEEQEAHLEGPGLDERFTVVGGCGC
jgi:hypothetical protein